VNSARVSSSSSSSSSEQRMRQQQQQQRGGPAKTPLVLAAWYGFLCAGWQLPAAAGAQLV
jgi:hypothetical protein